MITEAERNARRVELIRNHGPYLIGKVFRVVNFVNHGGNLDDSHQYEVAHPDYPHNPAFYFHIPGSHVRPWAAEGTENAKTALPNPKQLYGDKKPPLDEFPLSAQIYASLAGYDGDNKYGFRNWRDHPVEARTYIKAAMRHLRLFEVGEDFTRDSSEFDEETGEPTGVGIHNLGAVIMGCAILIDAQVNGTLIDNRSHSKAEADLLHEAEKSVAYLQGLQAKRDAEKRAKLTPAHVIKDPPGAGDGDCYCGLGGSWGHAAGCPEGVKDRGPRLEPGPIIPLPPAPIFTEAELSAGVEAAVTPVPAYWPDYPDAGGDAPAADPWKGPGEAAHEYVPDAMAMGDCAVCGHTYQSHLDGDTLAHRRVHPASEGA